MTAQITTTACPQCHAQIPSHPHFVTWCPQCLWNLQPYQPDEPNSRLSRLYASLGKRWGQQLFGKMKQTTELKPRWTLSKILLFGATTLIHALTLGLLIFGLYLVIAHFPNFFALIVGGICIALAWTLRPRLGKLPENAIILSAQQAPQLYALFQRVADAIGAKRPDMIVVDHHYNASFRRVGWKNDHVITLGLPLWMALEPQERVALLGHELGHSVNGDSTRSFWVGSALETLEYLAITLRPPRLWEPHGGLAAMIGAFVGNLISLILSQIAWLMLRLLVVLFWRDSQRAEYLADYVGASVAGNKPMLAMLDKIHLNSSVQFAIQRSLRLGTAQPLTNVVQQHLATIPDFELRRLHEAASLEDARLDATHPPTAYRFAFLESLDGLSPKVELSASEHEAINQELAQSAVQIQKELKANTRGFN